MTTRAPFGHVEPTKAELEQDLIDTRAEQDMPSHQARKKFFDLALKDLDWWYAQAKDVAEKGGRNAMVRMHMIKAILDKIAPDKKEVSRGAARVAGVAVAIHNVNRGTEEDITAAVDHRDRVALELGQRHAEDVDEDADEDEDLADEDRAVNPPDPGI